MDETYPIILDGLRAGTLTVTRQGLMTQFAARCEDPGRLLRLSVYGGGREGYLGVMAPENGALTLCRRLSHSAMEAFPETIEYAAEAGEDPPPAEESPDEDPAPAPLPELPEPETDVIWFTAGDGSLFTELDGVHYRAIPMAAWGLPMDKAAGRRFIDGVEYAIFAVENDKVI